VSLPQKHAAVSVDLRMRAPASVCNTAKGTVHDAPRSTWDQHAYAAASQAEVRSHESARRQAEAALAEARLAAEEQAAARQQPTRGPSFGKGPRLPGFVSGWQQAGAGDDGSRRTSQGEVAARQDPGFGRFSGDQRPEAPAAHGALGHGTTATAQSTAAAGHGTAVETHEDEAGARHGSEEDDVLVVLSASDDDAAAAGVVCAQPWCLRSTSASSVAIAAPRCLQIHDCPLMPCAHTLRPKPEPSVST